MSRTYRRTDRDDEINQKRKGARRGESPFRCSHCKAMVGPVPSGGSHRNHCPYCLHSRHVDGRTPGDRAGRCGSLMAPAAAFVRRNGEYVLVHHCLGCGFERHNRIAADDYFALVLELPLVDPRPQRRPDPRAREELTA